MFPDDTKQEVLAQNLREQAIASYQRNDYLKSSQLFEAASLIDGNGNESKFLNLQYYSQLSAGLTQNAIKTAQRITKKHPYAAMSYQQLGLAQLWNGEREEAVKNFRKALEFDSHSPKLHFYLGVAQETLGKKEDRDKQFQKAEEEYLQILSKNPKDFISNYDLASLYLHWNRHLEEAERYLKTAKKAGPDAETDVYEGGNIFSHFYFPVLEGILAFRQGKLKEAEGTFLTAIQNSQAGLRADLAEVNYYLGLVKEAQSDLESSKTFFNQSLVLDPKGPFAILTEAKVRTLASPN